MLKFINSDIIQNSYIRILLLISIISISTYFHYKITSKKVGWSTYAGSYGNLYTNYFGYFIIFFVIPKLFQIDNSMVSFIINFIGFIITFIAAFLKPMLIGVNIFLIIISYFID
tara:strand:- start:88 stop:429 length:342 start_codon:yes stop_codon:yes gene_type:complete